MGKTGHRIWDGAAIFISGLMILICVLGIAGLWFTERALSNSVIQVLDAFVDVSESIRRVPQGVDLKLEEMQAVSTSISTAAEEISQKVTDKGLVLLFLPEEKEQNLVELSTSVKDRVSMIRETLSAGLDIYRTMNQLPFVNLPVPGQEKVDQVGESIEAVQSAVNQLESEITAFRSGASDRIDRVGQGADLLTSRIDQSRKRLADLDARLVVVQEELEELKQTLLRILILAAILITLLLVWVLYSQIELLRMYIPRWKASGTSTRSKERLDLAGGEDELSNIDSNSVIDQ